jgi:hypothetical protein
MDFLLEVILPSDEDDDSVLLCRTLRHYHVVLTSESLFLRAWEGIERGQGYN